MPQRHKRPASTGAPSLTPHQKGIRLYLFLSSPLHPTSTSSFSNLSSLTMRVITLSAILAVLTVAAMGAVVERVSIALHAAWPRLSKLPLTSLFIRHLLQHLRIQSTLVQSILLRSSVPCPTFPLRSSAQHHQPRTSAATEKSGTRAAGVACSAVARLTTTEVLATTGILRTCEW